MAGLVALLARSGDNRMPQRHFLKKGEVHGDGREHGYENAPDEALDRLLRADLRRELAAAEPFSDVVGPGVAKPDDHQEKKDEPRSDGEIIAQTDQ